MNDADLRQRIREYIAVVPSEQSFLSWSYEFKMSVEDIKNIYLQEVTPLPKRTVAAQDFAK